MDEANYEALKAALLTRDVLHEVGIERRRQDALHGPQRDVPVVRDDVTYSIDPPRAARAAYERNRKAGRPSHVDIIKEEFSEAVYAVDIAEMRKELIETAASCVKAVEAIDWQAAHEKALAANV